MTSQTLRDAIAAQRGPAYDEARKIARLSDPRTGAWRGNGCVMSRGTFLCTLDARGQGGPRPEAEAHSWGGSLKEIKELVALVETQYPEVTEVYLGGGYDIADSPRHYQDGDYEPSVTSWSLTLWTREKGWVL